MYLLFGSEDREDLFGLITKSIISLPAISSPIQLPRIVSNQAIQQEVTHFVPWLPSLPPVSCSSPLDGLKPAKPQQCESGEQNQTPASSPSSFIFVCVPTLSLCSSLLCFGFKIKWGLNMVAFERQIQTDLCEFKARPASLPSKFEGSQIALSRTKQ